MAGHIEHRIAEITREIEALAASDERTRRLMTVPGIGPLVATAFVASAGNASQFRRAKDLAAWLGWSLANTQRVVRRPSSGSAKEAITTSDGC